MDEEVEAGSSVWIRDYGLYMIVMVLVVDERNIYIYLVWKHRKKRGEEVTNLLNLYHTIASLIIETCISERIE